MKKNFMKIKMLKSYFKLLLSIEKKIFYYYVNHRFIGNKIEYLYGK